MELGKDLTQDEVRTVLCHMSDSVSKFRGNPLGQDAQGLADIEFSNAVLAFRWIEANSLSSCADFRDPVAHLTDGVVVQVYLYDYAKWVGMMNKG